MKKREAEAEAKNGGKGIWDPSGPQVRAIFFLRRGALLGLPSLLARYTCELSASIQRFTLNFGVFIDQDCGTQHAGGFTGIYDYLEGEADRWYVCQLLGSA